MKRTTLESERRHDERRAHKRAKLSPGADNNSDSSIPSSASISEDSALQSSPPRSEDTRRSSASSLRSSLTENGPETASSSSSGEDSSASDAESNIVTITLGGPKKPDMGENIVSEESRDLRSRLADLLPQLAQSNELLATQTSGYNIEDVDEEQQHIEMNLSLGVLEHKNMNDESSSEQTSDCEDDRSDLEDGRLRTKSKTTDIMSRLMGERGAARQPKIEKVG